MKPKQLHDGDPWMLAEDIPDCDIFFFQIPLSHYTNDKSYKFLRLYKKALVIFHKFHLGFYFAKNDSNTVGESILRALIERPGFGGEVNRQIMRWSAKLIQFATRLPKLPLKQYSNWKLWRLYKAHDTLHTKLYTYGWLPVAVDMFHNNFTNKAKQYLYSVCDSQAEAEQAFVVLTTPTRKSIVATEREEFLGIYETYRKGLLGKQTRGQAAALRRALDRHSERWGHMGYNFSGTADIFGPAHYFKELHDLARSRLSVPILLKKEQTRLVTAKKHQAKLIKTLGINRTYQHFFEFAREAALTKLYRRHAQLLAVYLLHQTLLPVIAERLGLNRPEVQFLLKDEVRAALLGGKKVTRKQISQRLKFCAYYTEKGFEKVYIGKPAKSVASKAESLQNIQTDVITGQTASPGYAKGRVKIIIRARDMAKMNAGDILVSIATDPDIVPAMKKAAAIVTEQGGITSHAAIVSRELGKPCIIGTKIATRVLKDGDMVEVDAERGIVRKV